MSFVNVLSICMCASFLFGFDSAVWDLIVFVSDYCFSIYFVFIIFVINRHFFLFIFKNDKR